MMRENQNMAALPEPGACSAAQRSVEVGGSKVVYAKSMSHELVVVSTLLNRIVHPYAFNRPQLGRMKLRFYDVPG